MFLIHAFLLYYFYISDKSIVLAYLLKLSKEKKKFKDRTILEDHVEIALHFAHNNIFSKESFSK